MSDDREQLIQDYLNSLARLAVDELLEASASKIDESKALPEQRPVEVPG